MNKKYLVFLVTLVEVLLMLVVAVLFGKGIINKTAFICLLIAIPIITLPIVILIKRKL